MRDDRELEDVARKLFKGYLAKGYEVQAVHTYCDRNGSPLYWVARLRSASGEKQIRPFHFGEEGRYVVSRPKVLPLPLYGQELLSDTADVVFVVEGEQKADLLVKLGGCAVTSGAATTARNADWSPVREREVVIWPDNDEPGLRYAADVYRKLSAQGCQISVIDAEALGVPTAGDVVDWLQEHPGATLADVIALPRRDPNSLLKPTPTREPVASRDDDKPLASMLVDFICANVELVCDPNSDVFALDKKTGETRRLSSAAFKDWLVASYYGMTGQSAREQSVREALSTVGGLARQHGRRTPVFMRVGHADDGSIYLDLGEPNSSKAIAIRPGSWEVVDRPPVPFVRPNGMRPLPLPDPTGSIDPLWELINILPEDRVLVATWLVEALRPDTPFPILEIIGQQGSAKSTTQGLLRELLDPASCNLRGAPRKVDHLYVSAGSNWVVSYENVSHLSCDMQDALCVVSTGGGYAKRRLYSDGEEHIIHAHSPVMINGISACVTNSDLVDRSLSLELPVIRSRLQVSDLRSRFAELHAHLLGGLLNLAANALAKLPDQQLPDADRPRMLEFAHLGMAVAAARGDAPLSFMERFNQRRLESVERAIDASPVATALRDWFERRSCGRFVGAATHLYQSLTKPPGCDSWPGTVKLFCDELRRVAPPLRECGILVSSLGKMKGLIHYEVRARLDT